MDNFLTTQPHTQRENKILTEYSQSEPKEFQESLLTALETISFAEGKKNRRCCAKEETAKWKLVKEKKPYKKDFNTRN